MNKPAIYRWSLVIILGWIIIAVISCIVTAIVQPMFQQNKLQDDAPAIAEIYSPPAEEPADSATWTTSNLADTLSVDTLHSNISVGIYANYVFPDTFTIIYAVIDTSIIDVPAYRLDDSTFIHAHLSEIITPRWEIGYCIRLSLYNVYNEWKFYNIYWELIPEPCMVHLLNK
jgi:hypothetical protein